MPARIGVIGHRGAAGLAPENSLAAIRAGLAVGCLWLEIDVHACDGRAAVIHDATVERTTDGRGAVRSFSWQELRGLRLADGSAIPELAEVLALMPIGVGLDIEVKDPAAVSRVLDAIVDHPGPLVLTTPLAECYVDLAQRAPADLSLGLVLGEEPLRAAQQAELAGRPPAWLVPPASAVDSAMLALAESFAARLCCYTVNDPAQAEQLWRAGVDGIFSDRPDRLLSSAQPGT